ncbi:MgtC/SapB family protein [Haliovirga abyssi]|uniref:MgtC/SapB/SrpB/YhiD N-terminal domain-containing protein n=1 Tax=Haliovirga abyssi TaxID=2996794 RepID=A0AAU9DGL8_9FUSO|nr:MgtC/SapB family protein [Haliovirga abyssi]BDU51632.1 hypothetical protein HLVA_22010 [Haliovirga abyssi]
MEHLELSQIFIRILAAVLTGGIIGLEREINNKPAGFITHTLLCVGAAVISIIQVKLSYETINLLINHPALAQGVKLDVGRLIAQVISGVGFLGAGTIIQKKGSIKGITTAATLWLTACLGIAVGLGYFYLALGTAVLMTILVFILKRIELYYIEKRVRHRIVVVYLINENVEKQIKDFLNIRKVKIRGKKPLSEIYNGEETERKTIFNLMVPKFIDFEKMIVEMEKLDSILKIIKM